MAQNTFIKWTAPNGFVILFNKDWTGRTVVNFLPSEQAPHMIGCLNHQGKTCQFTEGPADPAILSAMDEAWKAFQSRP